MANDKTEKATPKRQRESRKKGQVAKSTELNGAVVLGAGLLAISWLGPKVVQSVGAAMRTAFGLIAHPAEVGSGAGLHGLLGLIEQAMLGTVGPVMGIVLAAGVLVNVAQIGFRPSFTPLKPDFKRINPISGAKNVFGKRLLFEGGKALAKVGVIGAVVAIALVPQLTALTASVGTPPLALGRLLSSNAKSIIERAVIAYAVIALVDLIWQRRQHSKKLKMTKQEVKDEYKQQSLPPEVKSALRRRALQQARARMMAAVPEADVVVTNPTHYAVALSYDGSHPAPTVLAKGKGVIAAQIRRIATETGVPIVPDAPLARSLYGSVEIDQMIPFELYAAVAQVLAYVYRLASRRRAPA